MGVPESFQMQMKESSEQETSCVCARERNIEFRSVEKGKEATSTTNQVFLWIIIERVDQSCMSSDFDSESTRRNVKQSNVPTRKRDGDLLILRNVNHASAKITAKEKKNEIFFFFDLVWLHIDSPRFTLQSFGRLQIFVPEHDGSIRIDGNQALVRGAQIDDWSILRSHDERFEIFCRSAVLADFETKDLSQ